MSIENAFKENYEYDLRITLADKWIIFRDGNWVVYQRKYKAKKSINLYEGDSIDIALKILIQD